MEHTGDPRREGARGGEVVGGSRQAEEVELESHAGIVYSFDDTS